MAEDKKKEAATHAARAAKQMRHAASNTGDAAEAVAEHVKDEVVEGAVEAKSKIQELAKKAVFTEAGRGALFLFLGGTAAVIGVQKFQEAKRIRETLRETLVEEG